MAEDTPRHPAEVLQDLRAKSNMIVHQQRRANEGKFQSVNDAIGLQAVRRERERLMGELPPLMLVVDNTLKA
jgi:hypothetical protein